LKIEIKKQKLIESENFQLNTDVIMLNFIMELKSKWNPKTKTKTGYGYHGSSKGDEIEYTLYFDEYRCEWTDINTAFQGYVFKNINKFI